MTLENERRALEEQRRTLERERQEFTRRVEKVNEYEARHAHRQKAATSNVVKGEMFFSGVGSKQSLKKRYKDLIKIYHPDNLDGDKDTIQEINSEYNKLCAVYKI